MCWAAIEAPFSAAHQRQPRTEVFDVQLAQALEASEGRSQAAEDRDLAHGIQESLRTGGSSPFASAAATGEASSMGSSTHPR